MNRFKLKKYLISCMILLIVITGVLNTPVISYAEENDKSDMIATEDEKAPAQEVGVDGMIPVYGTDVVDGTYEIEVDSSSSMFRIVKAVLTVQDGNMSAVLTLSGTGYLKLYMGTGEEAVEKTGEDYAGYVEDADGAYTYTVPVEALNKELECTGFSKRKEKWYDHQIVFEANTLPEGAVLIDLSTKEEGGENAESSAETSEGGASESPAKIADPDLKPAKIDLSDGTYQIEVSLAGGTGRASITSPATIEVTDHTAVAAIEWSSSHYDYMIVNGETYQPVNEEGNSVFEIPVYAFDEEMDVIADTTAMSTPHEVAYTLNFDTASIQTAESQNGGPSVGLIVGIVIAVVIVIAVIVAITRKKSKKDEKMD